MSTHEIHSQASNFLSFLNTGVDPRTGQFTIAMSLPLPPANVLAGPSLSPTLSFSTLSSMHNRGYGLGWSLNVSELNLNPEASSLRLSSGEQFAVDWDNSDLSIGGTLVFLDCKLKTLVVTRLSESSFRVDLKSGESEILTQQNGNAYILSERRSSEGRRLFVDWLPGADDGNLIDRIRDESSTLLQVVRGPGEVTFVTHPDLDKHSSLRLQLSNDQLTGVYLPEIDQPFTFSYESCAVAPGTELLLPDELAGPLGAYHKVYWATDDSGHHVPAGGPFAYLPRVASWTHSAGSADCELHRYYQWIGDHNFLGFGSDQGFNWQQGRDNLYQVERDYKYEVVEVQRDYMGQTLATITRVWNRFHLQTLEVRAQGQCEYRVETTYGIDPALSWEEQPAWCQLPHTTVARYIDHARPELHRSEQTDYRYDAYGNVLHTRFPGGVEERSNYYPVDGAPGCPPDALGMVRYLKSKTVTPAPHPNGIKDGAAVISIHYTYALLDSLLENNPSHAVVISEQARDETTSQILETTHQHYVTDRKDHYGRDAKSINTLNGKATTTSYSYEVSGGELVTHVTVDGFENDAENRSINHSAQSLLTGLTTWEQNEAGARTRYEHDALGRVRRTVVAEGSQYEVATTARYHIADAIVHGSRPDMQSNPVLVEHTDVTGQRQRSWLDGAGRTVRVELEDLDHAPGVFREIQRSVYDAQGRIVSQMAQDWLPGNMQPLALRTLTRYDDWGHVSQVETADGVIAHVRHDPILRRIECWKQSAGQRGPRQVTLTNAAGNPIEQALYDEADRLIHRTEFTHDGLDRVIQERVKIEGQTDIVTRLRYDAYSRIVERELPDGSRIQWTYASHSDAHHPESVSVTPAKEAHK